MLMHRRAYTFNQLQDVCLLPDSDCGANTAELTSADR